ncbi:MAG TPA: hypothetical protein VG838_15160 [Opitutaceae bacterium]|nr:hypothetical protein [Opitutaceae bacterium]
MDLATARQHIQSCLERMNALYGRPVFDEWALLSLAAKHGGILAYAGPRLESFRPQMAADAAPLQALTEGRPFAEGDFEFAPDAGGTRYDALLKVGAASFLVCNHTAKTMAEIRADPRWLKAQKVFFELSEKFRADPLAG